MSNKSPKHLLNQIKSILEESKRHPLEDHPYHSKSDDQLKYIIKDAGEAAESMRSHGSAQGNAAESKYLDQVNDAATVLHYRKRHGIPDWYKEKYLKKKVNENVVDFGKEKESRDIKKFHSGLMKKVGEKATEKQKLVQQHIDAGKFPMKIGTRFTSEHSRNNNLPPMKVVGYHVDPKNPEERYGYHIEQGEGDNKTFSTHMIRDPKLEKIHGAEKWESLQKGIKPFEKLKSVSEDNIQETSKELLKRYKEKADIQAKELDAEAKQGKNPIENLKKITKASKRGLGAFKAHLKLRKMENK